MKPRIRNNLGSWALNIIVAIVLCFILLPLIGVFLDSFNSAQFNVFPLAGLSLKWYSQAIFGGAFTRPFINSVVLATAATIVALSVGALAALALVRYRFRGSEILNLFFLSPLIFPTFIFGLGALVLFVELGIFGSFESLLIAHSVIVSPFVVRVLISNLSGLDRNLEDASYSLGAGRFTTFRKITLPLMVPGLVAASLFSFVISFDEIGASIFLINPAGLVTLPYAMFIYVENHFDPTIAALSVLLMLFSVVVISIIQRFSKSGFFSPLN